MLESKPSQPVIDSLNGPLESNAQYFQMPRIPKPDSLNWRLVNTGQLLTHMKIFTKVEFNHIRQSVRDLVKVHLTNPSRQDPKQNLEEWKTLLGETLRKNPKLAVFLPDLWPIEICVYRYLNSRWHNNRSTKSRRQPPTGQGKGATHPSPQTQGPSVGSLPRPLLHSPRSLGPHRFIGDPQYILPRASIESSRSNEEPRPLVVSDRAMGMIAPRSSPLPTRPETPFQIATPPGTCYNCGVVPSSGTIPLGVQLTQAGFNSLAPYVSALEVVGVKHVGHIQLLLKWGEADRAAVCASIPPNLITPLGRILLEGILNDAGRLKTEKGTNDMQRIKPTGCQIHPLPSMAGVSASLQSFMAARGIEELTPTFVIAGIKTDEEFKAFSTLTEEDKIRVFLDSRSIKLNPLQTMMVRVAFKGTEYL